MTPGPHYLFSEENACALCCKQLKNISGLSIYLVPNRGAIFYLLCDSCIKKAVKGLPTDELRQLDQMLEKRAVELGLTLPQ